MRFKILVSRMGGEPFTKQTRAINVVDPNTGSLNLDPDPEFLPNLDLVQDYVQF